MSDASATPVEEPTDAGPACEKCGFVSDTTAACPKCGWYPLLGVHVEIDEAFERMRAAPQAPEEAGDDSAPSEPEWKKHVEVWRGLIPAWGWLLLGTTAGLVAAAIVARVATLNEPALQTTIGVTGLIGGVALAIVAHLVGFVLCSSDDAELSVAHLVVKPLATWKRLLAELPQRLWLTETANVGLTTALSAALIVGGIPYERLLDWNFKAPVKKSLVGAIAQHAAKDGGHDSLEDAMNAFADEAVGNLDGDEADGPKPAEPKPRKKLECLVFGYRLDAENRLSELLLAAERYGELKFVGSVRPKLSPKEAEALVARFAEQSATRPFVRTGQSGLWLRPKFACRATYTEWPEGRRPRDITFDELLDELSLN